MYDWRSLDHHGQLPLEWLGSELASFEALLATRRRKEGGWKKVMKPSPPLSKLSPPMFI